MNRSLTLIVALSLIMTSCSMPETKIYSLSLQSQENNAQRKTTAALNIAVSAPRYLSQPYIGSRSSEYQLEVSRYSKWDAPPDEIIRDAARKSLTATGAFREIRTSNFAPAGFYELEIKLSRFERFDSGSGSFAELEFDYALSTPEGDLLGNGTITKKVRLADKSFISLAQSLSTALSEGLAEMKNGVLKTLTKGS